MGKFKMPTPEKFLKRKTFYFGRIKDQVWIYLEREMQENADKKPYNTKVGNWLRFLRSLRYHYYCEAQFKYNRLYSECGPLWFLEFSKQQRIILSNLKSIIKQDIIEQLPLRLEKAVRDLGVRVCVPSQMLMDAAHESCDDAGLFMWILYSKYYKISPSILRYSYDVSSMVMMSAIMFLDLDECTERLIEMTHFPVSPSAIKSKKKSYYYEPNVKYGEYLQKLRIPLFSIHPDENQKPKKTKPILQTIKLRSDESFYRLIMDTNFINMRKLRNLKEATAPRKCTYKFWEAPVTLRNTDPKMAAYVLKLKLLTERPKKSFLKYKLLDNVEFQISTVCYSVGKPFYVVSNLASMPTGYTIIHGGYVKLDNDYVTQINGFWKYDKDIPEQCPKDCDCVTTWEPSINQYLDASKCHCGHYYDMRRSPTRMRFLHQNIFFNPPTTNLPLMFEHAKVYQFDFKQEHVTKTFDDGVNNMDEVVPPSPIPIASIADLDEEAILKLLLADLADTPLLIPHLPQAYLLNNLKECIRRRIKGPLPPEKHKQLMRKSQRRWLDLSHIDFRAKAYNIPFTRKELEKMNWSHRDLIQKMFKYLLRDFEHRMRVLQLEQSRLWWPTMEYDSYPCKSFLDVFAAYMPGRFSDTFVLNPYAPL